MTECLTDEELERLATQRACGADDDPEATRLLAHVQECPSCRQLLEECRENETFVDSVKTVLVGATGPDGIIKQYLDEAQSGPRLGDAVPGYAILHELHRGTQGVVYRAVQESTGRQVAIKFLREGVHASRSTRKRFEREIELVASLHHTNIIRVFDSGVSVTGHHYYVMDYVEGQPLHRYVWNRKLSLEATLSLFATVCDAVNYAHQHGVIHRDLKPSNILVDAEGVPRVLDFGLAKPLAEAGGTWASMTGEVVGTLPYMSPEQADGSREEVDIRSDVYSLGIILYLVLTGEYPYPVVGPIAEVLNHIAETEPIAPTRMWASKTGGVRYRDHAGRNGCVIDEDVETIILRSLAKDPARRYQNVAMLVEDVRRYLDGQPIEAKRDAAVHVLRKSLARYRIAAVATVAGIILVAAVALTIWSMYRRQSYAMRHAEALWHRAMMADSELASKLTELGDLALDRGDPTAAAEKYGAALALNQQLAAASLDNLGYQAKLADTHMRIGDAAFALNDVDRADDHYRRFYTMMRQLALAVPGHKGYQAHLAMACERLARLCMVQGLQEEAREAVREARSIRQALAEDPRAGISSITAYARLLLIAVPASERDLEKGLAKAQEAARVSAGLEPVPLGLLAFAYHQTGQPAKAAEVRQRALDLLPEGPSAARRAVDSVLTGDGQAFWTVQLSEALDGVSLRKSAER